MKKSFFVSALVIAIVTITSVNADAQCGRRGGGYRQTRGFYVPRPVVVVTSGYGYGGYNNNYYSQNNCRPRHRGGRGYRNDHRDNRQYNGNNGYNNNYNNNNRGGNNGNGGGGRRR